MRRRRLKDTSLRQSPQLFSGRIPMASLIQTLAVAECLNFHHAAQALGISQSSVSARIRALEEELGILLFERNTRGVRLTEAGRQFVERVAAGVDQLDNAVKTASLAASGECPPTHRRPWPDRRQLSRPSADAIPCAISRHRRRGGRAIGARRNHASARPRA